MAKIIQKMRLIERYPAIFFLQKVSFNIAYQRFKPANTDNDAVNPPASHDRVIQHN